MWIRDYAPIQVGRGRFVQFRYSPDYLGGQERYITPPSVFRGLPEIRHLRESDIVLDGGNVVRWNDQAILTDKVFRENPTIPPRKLRKELSGLLAVEKLIIIPQEPGDVLGHADGVVRFVDERNVLVNDYSAVNPAYGRQLMALLKRHRLECVRAPYVPEVFARNGIPSAHGCYVNFLKTDRVLVAPIFRRAEDQAALKLLEKTFAPIPIVPLDCRRLARSGGVLNCVSWAIEA